MAKSLDDFWNDHDQCQVGIFHKHFRNGDIVPGLYCQNHGKLIQWLSWDVRDLLITEGVEQLKEHPKKPITVEELFT